MFLEDCGFLLGRALALKEASGQPDAELREAHVAETWERPLVRSLEGTELCPQPQEWGYKQTLSQLTSLQITTAQSPWL